MGYRIIYIVARVTFLGVPEFCLALEFVFFAGSCRCLVQDWFDSSESFAQKDEGYAVHDQDQAFRDEDPDVVEIEAEDVIFTVDATLFEISCQLSVQ